MKTNQLSLDQAPPEDIPFRFFLSAPFFGLLAGIFITLQGEQLFLTTWYFNTIALTHMIVLGWLAVIMIGAFYQLIPVLIGGHVPFLFLARWVHGIFIIGILGLMVALIKGLPWGYELAASFLLISLFIFIFQTSIALFRVPIQHPTAFMMRVSLISLIITVILGVLLLGQLSGWWTLPINRSGLKTIHLVFGLLGWVGCLIIGVAFHVIPMFYLSKPFPVKQAWWISCLLVMTLILFPFCSLFEFPYYWKIAGGIPAILGSGLFINTVFTLFQARKRKVVDSTLRYGQVGMGCFLMTIPAFIVYIWSSNETVLLLFGILFLSFAVSATNGMLYKIVPFLVWLHRFSSLVGQVKVPFMKDIISDETARKQWRFSVFALLALIIGIIGPMDAVIRLGGILFSLSSIQLFLNLYRAMLIRPSKDPLPAES